MSKYCGALCGLFAVPLFSAAAFAAAGGPPAGVPHGPPPFVTPGPPAGVRGGPPAGIPVGPPATITRGPPPNALGNIPAGTPFQTLAANELGKLNAAHASSQAFANAAPNSTVGFIATYQTQMTDALTIVDLVARDAAITAAREQLALSSNKQLTPSAVTRIDDLLNIEGAPPDLGTTP